MVYVKQLNMLTWLEAYKPRLEQNITQEIRRPLNGGDDPPRIEDFADILDYCRADDDYCRRQKARLNQCYREARAWADKRALYEGVPNWSRLRHEVYERDHGVCWVCCEFVPWEYYELGHIVARMYGGLDTPDNVVVMCISCNRLNPEHETQESAKHKRVRNSGGFVVDGKRWQVTQLDSSKRLTQKISTS